MPIDGSTLAALVYLALPNLLFSVGWFRAPYSALLCGAILFSLARALSAASGQITERVSRPTLLVILATSLAWSAFGGGSHFVYANPDWWVRDAVLGDLVRLDWPISYLSPAGTEFIFRSALGYYLPPALFGKLFGLGHLAIAVYAWTVAGVFIFLRLLPLPRKTGWPLLLSLALVVFFSGMDFIGELIATQSWPPFPLRLEWWVPLSYPSLTNQLLWAPNHCLPIWIAALLVFRHLRSPDRLQISATMLPLTLIWTPFAAIGVAPFIALGLLVKPAGGKSSALPWSVILGALIIAVPIGLFLIVDAGNINASLATTGASLDGVSYTLQTASFHDYALFVSCEFLFLALTLAPHITRERSLFWLAVAILLALPALKLGPSNDLLLRLCAPALLAILIACLQTLIEQRSARLSSSLVLTWIFLALGVPTAFNEFWRAAAYHRKPANYAVTFADTQAGLLPPHYVGRLAAFPLKGWLRKPSATPVP